MSAWLEVDDSAFSLDRETQDVRSWWITDTRLVGNPISVLLYLRLVAVEVRQRVRTQMPTQTEAMAELGLGEHAWLSAKRKLMCAGFLIEIQDRFPRNYVHLKRNEEGRITKRVPRGGQKRYRLRLRDPKPNFEQPLEKAVFELDQPYEEWVEELRSNSTAEIQQLELPRKSAETPVQPGPGLSRPENSPGPGLSRPETKRLISPAPDYPDPGLSAPGFPDPFIGTQERIGQEGLDGINIPLQSSAYDVARANERDGSPPAPLVTPGSDDLSRQGRGAGAAAPYGLSPAAPVRSTPSQTPASSASHLDSELQKIHPTLSVKALTEEFAGRLDLRSIDLVHASRDILSRAKRDIGYAPSYVAVGVLKAPSRYRHGNKPFTPKPSKPSAAASEESRTKRAQAERAACAEGQHDWGPASWGEEQRAHCIRDCCGIARSLMDAAYAAQFDVGPVVDESGGARWGA